MELNILVMVTKGQTKCFINFGLNIRLNVMKFINDGSGDNTF